MAMIGFFSLVFSQHLARVKSIHVTKEDLDARGQAAVPAKARCPADGSS